MDVQTKRRARMEPCIKVLGSGSKGNCVILSDSRGKTLVIDMGVNFNTILKNLKYDTRDLVGALCSHRHKDHSKYIPKFIEMGIDVYANDDVASEFPKCKPLHTPLMLDGFKVSTFGVDHDVENNAFIIDTYDGVRVLYVTDARYIQFTVRHVNYAVIECNHDDTIIHDDYDQGVRNYSQSYNHLDKTRCADYINAIKSPDLHGVILFHLSSTNIDASEAKKYVMSTTGLKDVYVAKRGLEIPLEYDF